MDHIGTGKDWDLATRSGGIKILPPYITAYDNTMSSGLYSTRLEALAGILHFISRAKEEYAVLSDCDTICNIDLNEVLEYHKKNEADITLVAKTETLTRAMVGKQTVIEADTNGRITDIAEQTSNMSGNKFVCMNILIMSRLYLQNLVLDAIAHGYKHFYRDSMMNNVDTANFFVYEHKGYHASITSPSEYFKCNMQLLEKEVRDDLLNNGNRPILTKVRNSPPTKYVEGATFIFSSSK